MVEAEKSKQIRLADNRATPDAKDLERETIAFHQLVRGAAADPKHIRSRREVHQDAEIADCISRPPARKSSSHVDPLCQFCKASLPIQQLCRMSVKYAVDLVKSTR